MGGAEGFHVGGVAVDAAAGFGDFEDGDWRARRDGCCGGGGGGVEAAVEVGVEAFGAKHEDGVDGEVGDNVRYCGVRGAGAGFCLGDCSRSVDYDTGFFCVWVR